MAGNDATEADERTGRVAADVEQAQRTLAQAVDTAERARARVMAVQKISERTGPLMQGPMQEHAAASQVAAALQAWEGRPQRSPLEGETSDEIAEQLNQLLDIPEGDLEPAAEVVTAFEALRAASHRGQEHESLAPPEPPLLPNYDEAELQDLANLLSEPLAVSPVENDLQPIRRKAQLAFGIAGAVAFLAAIGTVVVGVAALALLLLGAGIAVYGRQTRLHYLRASVEHESQRIAASRVSARRSQAERRCADLRLAADPQALRGRVIQLAVLRAEAQRAKLELDRWLATRQQLAADWPTCVKRLAASLASHSAPLPDSNDLNVAYENYAAACRRRSEQARDAARRPDLETALRIRKRTESDVAAAAQSETDALLRLQKAASACGIRTAANESAEDLCAALRDWDETRRRELVAEEQAMQLWAQREQLLGGATEEELIQLVDQASSAVESHEWDLAAARRLAAECTSVSEAKAAVLERARAEHGVADTLAEEAEESSRQRANAGQDRDERLRAAEESLEVLRVRHSDTVGQAARLLETATAGFQYEQLAEWRDAVSADESSSAAEEALKAAEAACKVIAVDGQQRCDELALLAEDAAGRHLEATRLLTESVDQDQVAADVDDACAQNREALHQAEEVAAGLRGSVEERKRHLVGVPECVEELAQAKAEQARVRDLQKTLELTDSFLARAQDRVHNDVAPLIAERVRKWLPIVTGGRYVDCVIDPSTLQMRVFERKRQDYDVEFLSRGTVEQIYLLLRVALADLLVKDGETSPLLLDDVTVQSDSGRKEAMLGLLQLLARDRQIILFSQEAEVAAWAESHLGERDRLVRLKELGKPAPVPLPRREEGSPIPS